MPIREELIGFGTRTPAHQSILKKAPRTSFSERLHFDDLFRQTHWKHSNCLSLSASTRSSSCFCFLFVFPESLHVASEWMCNLPPGTLAPLTGSALSKPGIAVLLIKNKWCCLIQFQTNNEIKKAEWNLIAQDKTRANRKGRVRPVDSGSIRENKLPSRSGEAEDINWG